MKEELFVFMLIAFGWENFLEHCQVGKIYNVTCSMWESMLLSWCADKIMTSSNAKERKKEKEKNPQKQTNFHFWTARIYICRAVLLMQILGLLPLCFSSVACLKKCLVPIIVLWNRQRYLIESKPVNIEVERYPKCRKPEISRQGSGFSV